MGCGRGYESIGPANQMHCNTHNDRLYEDSIGFWKRRQLAGMKLPVLQMEKFSIKQLYLRIRGDCQKVERRKLVCNNASSPKWISTLYLALHGKLLTKDRLAG
ncbi:hypothetical protein KY289_028124 [Solanum tuberosum]|nr:hypothetical protein KY289_028124 [Solanum tuberosum]KAH0662989.1 hypothetical protein KY284_027920 [Solanum tuberosum]